MIILGKYKKDLPQSQWAILKIQRLSEWGPGLNAAIIGWIKAVIKQTNPNAGWGFNFTFFKGVSPLSENIMMVAIIVETTVQPINSWCNRNHRSLSQGLKYK